jgi:hypothetical protein
MDVSLLLAKNETVSLFKAVISYYDHFALSLPLYYITATGRRATGDCFPAIEGHFTSAIHGHFTLA